MKSIRKIYLFAALTITVLSCGGKESVEEEKVDIKPSDESMEAIFQKMDLGLNQKSAWKSHWSSQGAQMAIDEFEWVFTDSIDPMEMPEKNPILENDPLFPYQFAHPEGNGTIDIYSYKIEAQDGVGKPYLNPDSEVVWYRADGMKERLLFMGPSGMFEEGHWLSPSEFLVMGYFQEDEGYRPMLWLIRTDTHLVSQFKLKKVVGEYSPESYLSRRLKGLDLSSNEN